MTIIEHNFAGRLINECLEDKNIKRVCIINMSCSNLITMYNKLQTCLLVETETSITKIQMNNIFQYLIMMVMENRKNPLKVAIELEDMLIIKYKDSFGIDITFSENFIHALKEIIINAVDLIMISYNECINDDTVKFLDDDSNIMFFNSLFSIFNGLTITGKEDYENFTLCMVIFKR